MKKTGFLGTTYYTGKHFEIVNGVKTKHIFAGGMRIAQISGGVRYYHHKDHLGSTTGVTDDTGWLVWASDYEPYGLPRSTWQKTTSMDSLILHRFTDQEYDAETRLYNYNARLYDPSIARFISPDTIVDNPYSSLALNRYLYVAGNPLRYTDPSGHIKFGKFWKRAIGSSISTVMDDHLGIEQVRAGFFAGVGGEVGFDFRNNGVEMNAGVGVGDGAYVSVSTPNIDFNYGYCKSATVGYDTRNGAYASASWYFGTYHASATYYFRSGYYSVGLGTSSGGYGVNVGYARGGGFSVGGSVSGYGISYNLRSGRLRGSADVTWQVDRYTMDMQADQASGITGDLLAGVPGRHCMIDGGGEFVYGPGADFGPSLETLAYGLMALGIAATAPEAYTLLMLHPEVAYKAAEFLSGYAPGPPPLTQYGVIGYGAALVEDRLRQ